jgi:hypothetical protein
MVWQAHATITFFFRMTVDYSPTVTALASKWLAVSPIQDFTYKRGSGSPHVFFPTFLSLTSAPQAWDPDVSDPDVSERMSGHGSEQDKNTDNKKEKNTIREQRGPNKPRCWRSPTLNHHRQIARSSQALWITAKEEVVLLLKTRWFRAFQISHSNTAHLANQTMMSTERGRGSSQMEKVPGWCPYICVGHPMLFMLILLNIAF